MPRLLLCQLWHLPGEREVLLENATATAVPALPPARASCATCRGRGRCCWKMPRLLLCQLCHLPGPAVPPAGGGGSAAAKCHAYCRASCATCYGERVLLENATPTAVPAVPPARGGEVLLENATPAVPPAKCTAVPPVPVMPVVSSVHPQHLFHITPTLLYLTKIKSDTRIASS